VWIVDVILQVSESAQKGVTDELDPRACRVDGGVRSHETLRGDHGAPFPAHKAQLRDGPCRQPLEDVGPSFGHRGRKHHILNGVAQGNEALFKQSNRRVIEGIIKIASDDLIRLEKNLWYPLATKVHREHLAGTCAQHNLLV
jgi:hypothetical protein